jgi:serine protease Do
MQCPFDPSAELPVGRFLVQDPDRRARILPLFAFATGEPDERVVGWGTAFRVDPFANCATAFHVFEDAFVLGGSTGREMVVRNDRSIVALEVEGLPYGTARILPSQWRSIHGAFAVITIDEDLLQPPRLRNLTELLALSIPPSLKKPAGTEFLDCDISSWKPAIGEIVLGLGYPHLDKGQEGASDNRPISQYMYGAYGHITDIESSDLTRRRPWPLIRVAADWPAGMSGGPVFNSTGNVIGLISSGIDSKSSSAVVFGGLVTTKQTFTSLDPARPGWFLCHAVLNTHDKPIAVCPNRKEANAIAAQHDGAFVSKVSFNHARGYFVRLEL